MGKKLLRGFGLTTRGFDELAGFDVAGTDFDAANSAVFVDDPYALQIGFPAAFGDSSHVLTDTAFALGLTAPYYTMPDLGAFSAVFTPFRHGLSCSYVRLHTACVIGFGGEDMLYFRNGAVSVAYVHAHCKLLALGGFLTSGLSSMKPYAFLLPLGLMFVLSGCAHLGERFGQAGPPGGAASVESILADLAGNEAHIQHFSAKGHFVLKTPELDTVYSLRQSDILFRQPADLFVEGRKYTAPVLRLTCSGDAFLIELPTEKQFYYRVGGEHFEGLSFNVTPVDIARELFLPEGWNKIERKRVRLVSHDETTHSAELAIAPGAQEGEPLRRVWVQGLPWVVVRSELQNPETGEVIAETTKSDYYQQDEARFAKVIEARFPRQEAFMRFEFRSFDLDEAPEDADFDLDARLAELRRRGHEEIEGRGGEMP